MWGHKGRAAPPPPPRTWRPHRLTAHLKPSEKDTGGKGHRELKVELGSTRVWSDGKGEQVVLSARGGRRTPSPRKVRQGARRGCSRQGGGWANVSRGCWQAPPPAGKPGRVSAASPEDAGARGPPSARSWPGETAGRLGQAGLRAPGCRGQASSLPGSSPREGSTRAIVQDVLRAFSCWLPV